ncbi:lipopolysaccharide biosynthesis protein [Nocardia alni]|uniref:lipopolysaccharide biosynthesis protein n=1 Tax=Nocardia alni TaxID=2815723 RepID=UPI0020B23718|nr:polysaccharide biosynthesis protein [Nocardia alni]
MATASAGQVRGSGGEWQHGGVRAVRWLPDVADVTWVTVGAMAANVAGYLLQLLAGRWLGAVGYSEFASLLAVQLLCAVPALALQNVVARELVRGASVSAARGLAWRCAGVVTVLVVALIPVVSAVLHVGASAAAGALVAAPAQVLVSGEQGVLQGGRRFRALATVLGGTGIVRVAPALLALMLGAGPAVALWATAFGLFMAALGAHRISSATPIRGPGLALPEIRMPGGAAVLRAAQVQAALMALSSVDLIVARIVLSDADAGRYALGAIATKIAFWLPQAVGVVLYPRMAQPRYSARAVRDALGVLLAVGIVAVLGAAVLAPVAPLFAGREYAPIEGWLWLFALDGALLALLQGALLSAIAVDRTVPAAMTWVGLVVEVGAIALFARSLPALITTATVVVAVVTAAIIVVVLRAATRGATVYRAESA